MCLGALGIEMLTFPPFLRVLFLPRVPPGVYTTSELSWRQTLSCDMYVRGTWKGRAVSTTFNELYGAICVELT